MTFIKDSGGYQKADLLQCSREPDTGIFGPSKLPHNLKLSSELLSQSKREVPVTVLRSNHVRFFVAFKYPSALCALCVTDCDAVSRLVKRFCNIRRYW